MGLLIILFTRTHRICRCGRAAVCGGARGALIPTFRSTLAGVAVQARSSCCLMGDGTVQAS